MAPCMRVCVCVCVCVCELQVITPTVEANGEGAGDRGEPQTAWRLLSEGKLNKINKRGSTSGTQTPLCPEDVKDVGGFRRHVRRPLGGQNEICLSNLFPSGRGRVTSTQREKVGLVSVIFYNMERTEASAGVQPIQISEQCTQVAKSSHQRCHSSWQLSPYCTLLEPADSEIGRQLPTGSLPSIAFSAWRWLCEWRDHLRTQTTGPSNVKRQIDTYRLTRSWQFFFESVSSFIINKS